MLWCHCSKGSECWPRASASELQSSIKTTEKALMGVNEAAESDRAVDSKMGLNLMGTETFEPTIGYWTGVGDFELIQRWHLEERQFQLMGGWVIQTEKWVTKLGLLPLGDGSCPSVKKLQVWFRYNGFLEVAEKWRKEKNNIIFFGSLIVLFIYFFSLMLEGKCHVVSSEACTWLLPFPSSASVNQ